eukprot:15446519-Alexandrium_andersonii.AAC.2
MATHGRRRSHSPTSKRHRRCLLHCVRTAAGAGASQERPQHCGLVSRQQHGLVQRAPANS